MDEASDEKRKRKEKDGGRGGRKMCLSYNNISKEYMYTIKFIQINCFA